MENQERKKQVVQEEEEDSPPHNLATQEAPQRKPLSQWTAEEITSAAEEWAQNNDVKGFATSMGPVLGEDLVGEGKGPLNALRLLFPGKKFDSSNLLTHLKSLAAVASPPAALVDAQELKSNFFFRKYCGEGHTQLIKYAKACLEMFQKSKGEDKFFAVYIAFVQSSGYGKTRTLMEVAGTELLIYICARRAEASGFPRRDDAACLFLKLSPGGWMDFTDDANLDLKLRLLIIYKLALDSQWDMRGEQKEKQFNGQFASFWDAATAEYKKLVPNRQNGVAMNDTYDTLANGLVKKPFVMLAIDEASTLMDLRFPDGRTVFRALRSAMRDLQVAGLQMVLVLTDTYSNVSTFLPPIRFDASQRPARDQEERTVRGLFSPFILRTTCDVLRTVVGLGRPLVAEHADKTLFLQSKLAGTDDMSKLNADGLLALILVRVAVNISPQGRVSERLAASHMATILASSFDRETLLVTYVSEPPLAAAASQFWDKRLCNLFPALREALTNGAVSAGSAGEIAAQIVCLVAFDSQCAQKRLGIRISLEKFLHALRPAYATTNDTDFIPKEHLDATLSVLQFVQLPKDFEFTEEALQELYTRQTACVLPPGQAGADLLIPYKYGADEYSFVLVRVKNWTKASDFTDILTKLHPEFVFRENHAMAKKQCTRICMHLGDHTDTARQVHEDPHASKFGCKALELYSVAFRCVTKYDGLEDHLIRLLTTVNNAVEFLESTVFRYEREEFPVPESDSLEGFMGFPFVCGKVTALSKTVVDASAFCCNCRTGQCKGCVCALVKKIPCTSCQSSNCRNKAAKS